MSTSNMMDTVAGGETPQYESIKTVDVPTEKQEGTLGGISTQDSSVDKDKAERGEQTAENIRYGQGISESGMGGKTTDATGEAHPDNHGGAEAQGEEEELDSTERERRKQGHGPMPPVGA